MTLTLEISLHNRFVFLDLLYNVNIHNNFFYFYPQADGQGNLWLPQLWERLLSCSWSPRDNTTTPCSQYENTTVPDMDVSVFSSKYIEAAQTYAHALDALIRENCPEVR